MKAENAVAKPVPKRQMSARRKAFGITEVEALGDRQIRVVISTGQIDRSGDVIVQSGINLTNFKASKTVLWNHDQNQPVAACADIGLKAGRLEALVQFPDAGISAKADEIYGLLKAGVINAASIGFLPLDVEPVDGKNPRKGLRIDGSELLEFSFVSVPANPGAQVIERAFPARGAKLTRKGLYAVSQLAELLQELGYQAESAIQEAAWEGDGSDVPGQLTDALRQLGTALVDMTTEEVAELLAGHADDAVDPDADVTIITNAVRGLTTKSGRKLSKATRDAMTTHLDAIGGAHAAMVKMVCDSADASDDADPIDDDSGTKAARDAATKAAWRLRDTEILALSGA